MPCLTGVPQRLHIIRGPDNITVALATEVSMHCTVSGFPVPMVHWFKDGCLMTNSSASFSLHNNGQLLTITSGTCFFFLLCQIVMINQHLSLSGNINPITLMQHTLCLRLCFQERHQRGWRLVSLRSIQPERVSQVSSSLSSFSW